jgi:pyruvate/2-oxoacid:ferredoxin oxidoreductase beta subunit
LVAEFLSTQGRFAHLDEEQIVLVQQHIDERWELLERLEAGSSS